MYLIAKPLLIIILLYIIYTSPSADTLVSKPNDVEKSHMISEIIQNKNLFVGGSYNKAKNKLEWLDAVTYEDIRLLNKDNKLNRETINNVL